MAEKYPDLVKEIEEKGVRYTRVMPEQDDTTSPIGVLKIK
jgi:DNA invertase Pin-like site-specific DNA recombinase